jgi:hypothetical protein
MTEQAYQLRGEHGSVILSASDLAALALAVGDVIGERELRRRADQLQQRSLAGAIHAMLDQEELYGNIMVLIWSAPQG